MQVIDPVCKMTIEDKDAVATSIYKGTNYYFCSKQCKEDFDRNPESFISEIIPPHPPLEKGVRGDLKMEEMISATLKATGEMAKDPICGMVIPKDRSIKREVGGRAYYFCSATCGKTFEAPEVEMKAMKR